MTTPRHVASDPRIHAVEDNLLALFRAASVLPVMTPDGHDDVVAYHSDVPIPLFNAISGARFESGDRAREVLAPFLARGVPFMWWLTPSSTTGPIEAALAAAGLEPEHVPGMHRQLDGSLEVLLAPTVALRELVPDEFDAFMDVCLRGFEFPEFAHQPMSALLGAVAPGLMRHVVATVDGAPASCGSVFLHDGVAGLYNIATLQAYRGHGLGYAVTGALLELGRAAGCTDAVLHASELGAPVYTRAGFTEVCSVPQWVWVPS